MDVPFVDEEKIQYGAKVYIPTKELYDINQKDLNNISEDITKNKVKIETYNEDFARSGILIKKNITYLIGNEWIIQNVMNEHFRINNIKLIMKNGYIYKSDTNEEVKNLYSYYPVDSDSD
jgi:hypothetical protein